MFLNSVKYLATPVDDPLHLCIGVCGEECLKICNPEKFQEIFFGTEEDEDAKFLQLKDCGHIFEVSGLDQWIASKLPNKDDSMIEIVEICCPRCKTPIRKSKRYIGFLNQRAADIEQNKHHIRGLTTAVRKDEQKKFFAEVDNVFKIPDLINVNEIEILKFLEEPPTLMTKTWFTSSRNLLAIAKKLLEYNNFAFEHLQRYHLHSAEKLCYCDQIKKKLQIHNFMDFMNEEFDVLIERINIKEMSETIIAQLDNEVSRFGFINEIFIYMIQLYKANEDLEFEHANNLYCILKSLFGNEDFKDAFEKKIWADFKAIVKSHPVKDLGISEKERISIVKALDGAVTKWYKCPNGHLYGIGDCGQAMVETKCPECGTIIGGQNHRLQAGNSDATTEMRQGLTALQIPDPFVVRHGREW
uniref:RZ-type domain-containing protein n=1 Tax=Panagrolaimus sp. ES5 TaxID=591445 RepID=A0AC34FYY0_9BILA